MLLLNQITLGVLTVLLRKPADIASMHVAVGALSLLTAFVIGVRALRLHALPAAVTFRLVELKPQRERSIRSPGIDRVIR